MVEAVFVDGLVPACSIMIDIVLSFLCGAIVTIATLLIVAGFWFYSLPVVAGSDRIITYTSPLLPDVSSSYHA